MSFWQTNEWGKVLVKSKQVEKIIYIDNILVEKRSIALGQYGLFVLGLEDNKIVGLEKDLIDLCKKENCLFVQVETINNFLNNESGKLKELHFLLKSGYYKKFITPYTAIIDLSKTEEEILSEMKPKGRYNIKLAEKKGIEVKEVEKTDENIKIFYNLMLQTTSRDGFSGNKFEYYKIFLETIKNSKLLIAFKDGFPVSAGIFVFSDKGEGNFSKGSIYYYGASTNDETYRNLMAPYLLQWTAIKIAKELGSKYYDFLGVATPGDIKSSLTGVTDFKLKFTKYVINISDSYIWVNKKIIYNLFNILKFIRKLI